MKRGALGFGRVAAWATLLLGAGEGRVSAAEPSPVIFPEQNLALRFDHKRHLALGLTCQVCHPQALRSSAAADSLLPDEAACRGCHAIDRTRPEKSVAPGLGPARCDSCHPGFAAGAEVVRVQMPAPHLKFSHRLHTDRNIPCQRCHAAVPEAAMATRADLPHMRDCLTCHDGKQAPGRCASCHISEADGRLRTSFPEGKLLPSGSLRGFDAHTAAFARDHRQAGRDESYCLTCHKQRDCVECHGGVVRPMSIHAGDYVMRHAVEARRNQPDCGSCHRQQSFCVACHQRSGVASDPEGGLPGRHPRNPFGTGTMLKAFHPPGWVRDAAGQVITAAGDAQHHAFQARRNIQTCASCHREETCLECHAQGPGGSFQARTHAPGWASSARCRALFQRNRRACLKCHALDDVGWECR